MNQNNDNQQAVPWPWSDHYQDLLPQCILPLTSDSYKGSSGRIALLGGSPLYTGAPYYAAQAALQTGADLVTIFTANQAAVPLKCYSPELMVQAVYDGHAFQQVAQQHQDWTVDDITDQVLLAQYPEAQNAVQDMVNAVTENIARYHCLVVGPGLGRCPLVGYAVAKILHFVRHNNPNMPIVLDADALWFCSTSRILWQSKVLHNNPQIILTPNRMEFSRLLEGPTGKDTADSTTPTTNHWGQAATVIQKGQHDCIGVGVSTCRDNDPNEDIAQQQSILCVEPGGKKRSGGIGDVLAGTTATLAAWQHILWQQQEQKQQDHRSPDDSSVSWIPAAWTACHLVKRATRIAWEDKKRAMTAPDILERLGKVFDEMIGQEYNEPTPQQQTSKK